MKFLKKIQEMLDTLIHPAEVNIEVLADVVKIRIGLGGILANDDAEAVMKLAQKLTEIAYAKGYEPCDTPFHFSTAFNNEIIYEMEFFNNNDDA